MTETTMIIIVDRASRPTPQCFSWRSQGRGWPEAGEVFSVVRPEMSKQMDREIGEEVREIHAVQTHVIVHTMRIE